ncbi:hypothetical protein ACFP1I_03995 [Dyadobacter subterraneus]|uniref:Uncharacterized protein n=1 Tax=Dyadobacter subterraneus TaxID=2773304 RepID=A0ABR9WGT6_9BACT|nr:hypothetical protein [Dyadobacter subterraneus]MBE9464708.1 hypothetical protein [Dyadobacter subterraneus]
MKIYLATFSLKILNRGKDLQLIDRFNGADDFFDILNRFLMEIFQNRFEIPGAENEVPLYLTLEAPPTVDVENREIYGYFKSGISGDNFEVVELENNQTVMDVTDRHATFRKMFFYFKLPHLSNRAGVVLEKRAKFGIKGLLDRAINNYIQRLGYADYRIVLDNALHGRIFNEFMEHGRLTKVEIVKRFLPPTLEQWYADNQTPREVKGTIRTVMTSKAGLPDAFKSFIGQRYRNPDNFMVEVADNDIGHIEFELKLRGKTKKFYLANQDKAQPDIDVTAQIQFENGRPTTESMLLQSQELLDEILNLRPIDAG